MDSPCAIAVDADRPEPLQAGDPGHDESLLGDLRTAPGRESAPFARSERSVGWGSEAESDAWGGPELELQLLSFCVHETWDEAHATCNM